MTQLRWMRPARNLLSDTVSRLPHRIVQYLQLAQERARRFQVCRRKPFCEALIDWPQDCHAVRVAALITQQPGEAHRGPQFPGECSLRSRQLEGLSETSFGRIHGTRRFRQ